MTNDKSLEAIFHQRLKRTITPRVRGLAMGAFREALEIFKQHGDGTLASALRLEQEKERDTRT